MSRIPTTFNASAPDRQFTNVDAINDLELGTFLDLMIAELQNQDPLNPLDNKDMLAQISQIREVGATDKLTKTLEAVLIGQNLASATNLIGAEVSALSDDAENIEGIVDRVSIENGEPKLHIDLSVKAEPSSLEGELEKGEYAYRIVWEKPDGSLEGIDLSDDKAIVTTGTEGKDQSIVIDNLPKTSTPKQIYRTDKTGVGNYQLVGELQNGAQRTFVDSLSDAERSERILWQPFARSTATSRAYEVSLRNIRGIRPPDRTAPDDGFEEELRPVFSPEPRPAF